MSATRRKPTEAQKRMARFKAALALRHMGIREWASENDLSYSHVYQVVTGRREDTSALLETIDQFATDTLAEHAVPQKVA